MEEFNTSKTYDLMEINWDLVGKFLGNLALAGTYIFISVLYLNLNSLADPVTAISLFSLIILMTAWDLINIIIAKRKMSDGIFKKFYEILNLLKINIISIMIILILLIFSYLFNFPILILNIFCWILLIQGVLLCISAITLYIEKLLFIRKKKFSVIGLAAGIKGANRYPLTAYNLEDKKKNKES